MGAIVTFFKKAWEVCKLVPPLPVTVLAVIPFALLGSYRPWGETPWQFNPSLGQWIVILLVAYTVIDTLRGMVDDIRHGHVGVDILAVVAILSTLAVQEYWASWAIVLMIFSGEAIEEYAQAKAKSSLTELMKAAPVTAHVTRLPGVGADAARAGGSARSAGDGGDFRPVAASGTGDGTGAGTGAQAGRAAGEGDLHFETVPVGQVKLGDVLVVLPGETVPVDGELLSVSATLDLSNINGEPLPREVYAGARVMSGAINGSTTLTMRATELARDSQYQRILELVSSAQNSRATVVRTADLLAVPFTVVSFLIAGCAWIISGDPVRFAQVLVIATPCPLLIAAPVAYIAGTGRLARSGILIKTQEVLEYLGRVSHVFFDKTGTLTVKKPQVVRLERVDGETYDDDHILTMAGVVETYSVHILAQGIAKAGAEALDRLNAKYAAGQRLCPEADQPGHGTDRPVVRGVTEDSGNGVAAEVNGHRVRVGRFAYVTEGEAAMAGRAAADVFPHALAADEMSTFVSIDGRLAARIVLKDVPRANAKATLARLRELGVGHLSMLTGDKAASAQVIAGEVGIDDVRAELFPEDKLTAVRNATVEQAPRQPWWDKIVQKLAGESLSRPITMMVGDGVNDAPVLAAADIGMAITDGTSTAASESAQVVIMNDDIGAVPRAIGIARRTKRVMLQAVCVGLGLSIVAMVCAAFNLIPTVAGAFLQEAIDVVSILWALTALFDRD
ncbi:heavy metal translocating P-type ATPase [Bifidobacterium pullorum subsp. saeculare]|uniref:Heavy metal translocating P-type ATPase n=1 Tax=Bifidobacterium pullorum subsp. saeculare TaxID=78257 RepID=A0A938WYN8_9BIFI|nr:heavy metal translocating P-type ATPase [Bifidobacterium pullorum]MBM6700286.1 heavy metal translocating P-type ATPase [Bifidobacterium pullorum subsp. saeculare]